MRNRLRIFSLIFLVGVALVLYKLFSWQILKAGDLAYQAKLQHQEGNRITARRGNILASDGTWLAASVEGWLVYADRPKLQGSVRTIANQLAPFFVSDDELLGEAMRLEELLAKKDIVWVPLKNKVPAETKGNLQALGIPGIGFDEEDLRFYPEASAGAQVLGFVGKNEEGEDKGYFGLEGFYDLVLSGKPGFVKRESDASGVPLFSGALGKEIAARQGVDLLLNLDKTVQRIVEIKLASAIEQYGAKSGTVIVLDPKTGAVLAMVSYPSYDPREYHKYGDEFFKNPAISDSFEPGSIFKPLVMAAALDAEVVKPDTKCDICDGPVKVDKYEIETWNKKYEPEATMTDIIIHSDNVGMVFAGQKLGEEKLYEYLSKFGMGEMTEVDLQGEINPGLREKSSWSIVDVATASFGQGVAVTPIQMTRAVSALANKGKIVTPQVVDRLQSGDWEEDIKPNEGEKVISEKAARQITEMMVAAVKEGESKWVQARGFKVAGKTGTAQIPLAGHYDEEKTIASFVGFAPADNAKFVMLVTLREPQSSPWASETAAPFWFSIAGELFPYLGIQPEN
jgi:cell division protein FtsI/penicillin-binding protein 2